ncbi:MAG: long-chain acyl-CoA synthetase [Thermoleophilaceae bacterium]|nr:long-chain acyl-CoA synthetase [Thermoleophilaceae bacterium]
MAALRQRVAAAPDSPAISYRSGSGWTEASWGELGGAVASLAARLEERGIGAGSRVLLLADNGPGWLAADLAILELGAVSVPVYPTSAPGQVGEIARRSGARVAVCDAAHAATLEATGGLVSEILLDGLGLQAMGAVPAPRAPEAAAQDLAALVYTSGAEGAPKGVRLTHDNLIATAAGRLAVTPLDASDRTLGVLPMSHVAGRMNYEVYPLLAGAQVWFGGGLSTLFEDLADCRPTYFFGVPRVYEKLLGELERLSAEADPGSARAQLGLDSLRLATSGGAPVRTEVLERLAALGLEVLELYGQTESSGLTTINPPGANRRGTVGRPLPGVEVAIAGDGEILVRGPNVCDGYELDAERTTALIDADGWLHSGDRGALDSDGYLAITGRKRDMIVTSGGKNVYPAPIEQRLEEHPGVARAMVVGDGRPYLVALVEATGEPADAAAPLEDHLRALNAELSRPEQLKRIAVVPRFPPEAFTPTLKLRRGELATRLAPLLDELYERPRAGDSATVTEVIDRRELF